MCIRDREEREHGNSYVLATEGTDKTFIRGQQLLKHHSVPRHTQVNTVPKELPTPYTPPVTRAKTKSYLQAVTSTMPKGPKSCKGKEVCRRTITEDNVPHAGESRRGHEENNYGLFSLSADAGTASGSNLLFYAMVGIAILGMYLPVSYTHLTLPTICSV